MKRKQFSSDFFRQNREVLLDRLPSHSLALISASDFMPKSADQHFPFYQNKDFFYLTGLRQEKSILCMCKSHPDPTMRQVLFLLHSTPEMEIWTGHRYTEEEATQISGISKILNLNDFDALIKEFMVFSESVYMLQNESPKFRTEYLTSNDLLVRKIQQSYPLHSYDRLSPLMVELRMKKQLKEIEMIRHAIGITKNTLETVIRNISPGMYEYQVVAGLTSEILWNGADGHAFEPIVASGRNACILHYNTPVSKLEKEDLLLLDFGAEYEQYASDCSRTVPVSGRYSKRQKACYDAVLRVFRNAIHLYVPGNTINDINEQVLKFMEEEMLRLGLFSLNDVKKQKVPGTLVKKYFMHGTAHFIGLDVHDAGFRHVPFEKGMILSCEPGIYIPEENIGIRIENMILVDDVPVDLMAHIPVESEEIEAQMRNK
jgi:Xaa-Pro aminopeptidase